MRYTLLWLELKRDWSLVERRDGERGILEEASYTSDGGGGSKQCM